MICSFQRNKIMFRRFYLNLPFILIFSLISCGETNYLLNEETPSIYEGFQGFRWSTPMSIVEAEFPKQSGAQPESGLNTYNTTNFKNAHFLGEFSSLSKFSFSKSGLVSVKIIFGTNYQSFENLMFQILEKLIDIYGEPKESIAIIQYPEIPDYIVSYSWYEKRLELILRLDYSVEIIALSFSPLYGPVFNYN